MSDVLHSVIANEPPPASEGERREGTRAEQRVELGAQSQASRVGMRYRTRRPSVEQAQVISQGPGSRMEDVSQVSQFFLSEEDYYFELLPFELDEKGAGGGYVLLSPGEPLRAGQTYRIRVSLSQNQYRGAFQSATPAYQLDQRPFKLPEEVFVQLDLVEPGPNVREAIGSITPAQGRVSFTKSQDFEFTVQKDYRLDFTLQLTFWRNGEERLPYLAATLGLSIAGAEAAPPPPIGQVFDLNALTEPPPDTAFLHVSLGVEQRLKLFGWIGARADLSLSLDISAFEWANPANCPDEETYIEELTNKLYDYSIDHALAVSNWFEAAIQRYGEGCSIIIADEASALVPWEMFKLPDGRFVGAHALIVRSPGSQQETGPAAFGDSQKYEGRLCAYVHALDEDALARAAEMGRLLPNYHKSPRMLELDLMRQREPHVGLVYLSYGGVLYYGDEQQLIACLSRFKPYENDVQIRFNFIGNRLSPRPLFFANAPYSGRIFKTGQKAHGLARAILRQVAAGYIGTLGPVRRDYATRVAGLLLEEAASSEGVRPAELLRRLRAEAYERLMDGNLSPEEAERAYAEFALPFMYVYYGHPHDWLKVNYAPDSAEAEGGEQDV